jgi:hypothetical protein
VLEAVFFDWNDTLVQLGWDHDFVGFTAMEVLNAARRLA